MSDRIAVMHEGRVLQVGTPTDIYERPQVRFVADFIGDTNFLEAECCTSANGSSRFQLAGGAELTARDPLGHAPGDRVTLTVRPERAHLAANGQGALCGRLQNVVYFGTDTTYHVTLDGGGQFQIRMQNRDGAARAFEAGEQVSVSIPPDAIQVLAD